MGFVPENAHVAGRNSGFTQNRQCSFRVLSVLKTCIDPFATGTRGVDFSLSKGRWLTATRRWGNAVSMKAVAEERKG